MNGIMLLIFVMVLCAWFWPNCPKALKENKKLLLGVSLGFFFTKFMGNIEGLEGEEKKENKRNTKNPPPSGPSPIPEYGCALDDYCTSKMEDDANKLLWYQKSRNEKCPECRLKGVLGDYLVSDGKIDSVVDEGWKRGGSYPYANYRSIVNPSIKLFCSEREFPNIQNYLNREGQTICQNCS